MDFNNKELIKLMWLPDVKEVLLFIKDETFVPGDAELYNQVSTYLDIDQWKIRYSALYDKWLNDDDASVYDVDNEVNQTIINALIKVNSALKDKLILYWFDVDRANNENYQWKICPISKTRLIYLGDEYPKINSLVSNDFPLIFPSLTGTRL